MPLVMGTAGHIDHGKTSLVRSLTGIDTDRLEEEKRRGITIELGFAYADLPGGQRLGIVDVPGHERFVRNMVAGAAGIDFVLLVIAADEGVMPQTREHLEICSLLGIRHGLVAMTKIDMVDEELAELAKDDISSYLQGTFLENAPIFPVSSQTGQGLEDLRAEIARLNNTLQPERRSDLFRLPVDRIFSMKGHGTVVTGTSISGQAKVGDEMEIVPPMLKSRIRSIQSHGQDSEVAPAGRRTSINLHGLDVEQLERGDILTHPGRLFPSARWLVKLTCLSSSPHPLRHRSEIHFHHLAKEVLARLHFYDRDKLQPGDTALAEVRFSSPLAGVYGDRCIIRAFSPLRTVAGGGVLIPLDHLPSRREMTAQTYQLISGFEDLKASDLLAAQLDLAGDNGADIKHLAVLTNLSLPQLEKNLASLAASALAACFDKDNQVWISGRRVEKLMESCLDYAKKFHKREPMQKGMSRGVLQEGWGKPLPQKLVSFVLDRLLRQGKLVIDGDLIREASHQVNLADDQSKLRDDILAAVSAEPFTPPSLKEIAEKLGVTPKQAMPVLKLMQGDKTLTKISEDFYYSTPVIEDLKQRIVVWFKDHDNLTPGDFREFSGGLTRKYTIPLLEFFDKEKFTVRIGDKRQLRGKSN